MAQVFSSRDSRDLASNNIGTLGDWLSLMKPRVMSLALFTALIGMLVAPTATASHPILLIISLIAIAGGAGGSAVLNQWYDRDIDAKMFRTATRPLPRQCIDPNEAVSFGLVISAMSVLVLGFSANALAAGMLAFTIFFYAVIYTAWLKRRTRQNIVIGGAAGALPPVIGWLAAGGDPLHPLPWLLFAIIFIWTPPHFWALALVRKKEYIRAKVPMLPAVATTTSSKLQIAMYSLVLVPITLAPTAWGFTSAWFGVGALVLGTGFLLATLRLVFAGPTTLTQASLALFRYSITYLFLLFAALGVDAYSIYII
ncbi:MAG: heme o synthase [Proteobacteria bacterium]|nr:heme o synthase [Pseudomonadota bacterium]